MASRQSGQRVAREPTGRSCDTNPMLSTSTEAEVPRDVIRQPAKQPKRRNRTADVRKVWGLEGLLHVLLAWLGTLTWHIRVLTARAMLAFTQGEIEMLSKKAKYLESKLEFFRQRMGLLDQSQLDQCEITNNLLRETLRNQQYVIAGLKSTMAADMSEHIPSPVSTGIYLGTDSEQRRAKLLAMKRKKLYDARKFLEKRMQFMDPTKSFSESTRFKSADGDICASKFDVIPLYDAKSVKQVYDALVYYVLNLEICTAEIYGDVVVREEADTGDESVSHHRLVFSKKHGVEVETNNVIFSEYTPPPPVTRPKRQVPSGKCGSTCIREGEGLIVTDFVDEDLMYPYRTGSRVRDDLTNIFMVQLLSLESPQGGLGKEQQQQNGRIPTSLDQGALEEQMPKRVVVLTRWVQAKLHCGKLTVRDDRLVGLRATIDRVNDAILAAVRDVLVSQPPALNV